jgi:hypothetical protein
MDMKSALVATLLVLGCSLASAQTFGFASVGGDLYCEYEVLQQLVPYDVWQGADNLSGCGVDHNATIVGISARLSAAENPARFSVKGVAYADNIYDAFSESYTGIQIFRITDLKCSTKKYGWVLFASISGEVFGDNYGYLSCNIPGKNGVVATRGLSAGGKIPARK